MACGDKAATSGVGRGGRRDETVIAVAREGGHRRSAGRLTAGMQSRAFAARARARCAFVGSAVVPAGVWFACITGFGATSPVLSGQTGEAGATPSRGCAKLPTMTSDATNLADLVRNAADEHPDKPALVCGPDAVTWAELDRLVDGVAAGLIARGLVTGDRVGILLANRVEFAAVYFGTLRAGLVSLPLNTAFTAAELGYQLSDSGARLVVTDAGRAGLVSDVESVVVGSDEWAALAATAPATDLGPSGGDDLAVVLYTSGTTGRPKGAMLSHRALLANLRELSGIQPPVVAATDVVLLVLPLFHVYGLNAGLGMTAYAGATGVLAERFDPVDTLALVRDRGVTNIIGAPPMYVAWSMLPDLADSLTSVRLAVSGAAQLPAGVMSRIRAMTGHDVYEGYGLTETAPVLTTTLCSRTPKPGSVGRPIPGVELRLVDDTGDEVEDDDPGEIVVRGANLFSGYWPDATDGPDPSGWFATGDVAYADDDGDLFLVDRVRELILVSGFNVYPREVEDVIATHPGVQEVAVIGVPHPYTGETVKALVVTRPDVQLTAGDVIDHAAERLARFKCPTSVDFVDHLPHSVTGKVAKGRLRDAPDSAA
jgi:long-chain acyl-CoA synthetase